MSSKITVKPHSGVGAIGLISIIAGLVMILVGGVAWGLVATQLAAENITVASDSNFLANKNVNDPFSAFAQANAINEHAQAMTGGKTYAELEQDDPQREVVMNASFLRASLFTSVVAFGVSAFVIVVGLLATIAGWALRRMAGGPPLVIETSDSGPVEFESAVRVKAKSHADSTKPATASTDSSARVPQQGPEIVPSAPKAAPAQHHTGAQAPAPSVPSLAASAVPGAATASGNISGPTEPSPRRSSSKSSPTPVPVQSQPTQTQPVQRFSPETSSLPIVAVPPVEPLTGGSARPSSFSEQTATGTGANERTDKAAEEGAGQQQSDPGKPTAGNGWSTPADRLPKQP